jgi:hypothetical protein
MLQPTTARTAVCASFVCQLQPAATVHCDARLALMGCWRHLCLAGLAAVASCGKLRVLTVGSFNLVRPLLGRQDLRCLEHLSFGAGFANKGLHLLFPLLDLKSLHITVRTRCKQTNLGWGGQ